MIRSMTGYGQGECVLYNRKINVEIKSVNHRYNDLNIKLPRILNAYEDGIRKSLVKKISRGKTDVYINLESFSYDDVKISVNEALADAYIGQLNVLKKRYDLKDDLTLSLVSSIPDVISVERNMENEKAAAEILESLHNALSEAIVNFIRMREREGEALKNDLLQKSEMVKTLVAQVKLNAPKVSDEYREKLLSRMNETLASIPIDEARILTEAAIFADKSCIDEEITRLSSHMEQLYAILNTGGAVGRKLDFLVQEINREVNTIGSKSNDVDISKIVVDMKSEVEKIREQVQNIE